MVSSQIPQLLLAIHVETPALLVTASFSVLNAKQDSQRKPVMCHPVGLGVRL